MTIGNRQGIGNRARLHMVDAFLVAGLLVALTLVPATSSRAQIWQPSPEQPQHWYWFRTDRGVPTQVEYMDPRLQEVSDAFGRGDFEGTRRLAEGLLDSSDDANLCTEAVAFLIESHLAQGEFESARAAAERLKPLASATYQQALVEIQRAEALHEGELPRLRRVIGTSTQPAAVARARRELARARLRGGEGHKAFEYYYQCIGDDANSGGAEEAIRAISEVTTDCFGPRSAGNLLRYLRDHYPDTRAAAMAEYELAQIGAAEGLTVSNARNYVAVIEGYPGAEAARLGAAALREGAPELLAEVGDLHGWGRHHEVVAHFAELAAYFDSLELTNFASAVEMLCSSGSYFSLAEEALPVVAALLGAPGCRDDPAKLVVLYDAEGALALRTGDTDSALQAWQHLLDDYPGSESAVHAALQLGEHYLGARQPEQALAPYMDARRAVRHLSPEKRASAMVGLGLALEALDRYEEAIYEYRAAVSLAPDSAAAQEAAQALEWLESPP